jgi:HEAT repeat protein
MKLSEHFKGAAAVLSTLIIALAGTNVTHQYNSKQLEISRAHELTQLIPHLNSADINERKLTIISLSLHGEHAVLPLIATLADPDNSIKDAGIRSLVTIGQPALPQLEAFFANRFNDYYQRSEVIYALGLIGGEEVYQIALRALTDPREIGAVQQNAATVMGFLKEKRPVPTLLKILQKRKDTDYLLSENIAWALGQIGDPSAVPELKALFSHPDDKTRVYAVWSLLDLGGPQIATALKEVAANDQSEDVRRAANNALFYIDEKEGK